MLLAKVSQFEKEKPIIYILVLLVVVATVGIELHEINEIETFPDYNDNVVPFLLECSTTELPDQRGQLKWWMLCASHNHLGNERIIPFIFSIILIPITFGFVSDLTKYKTVGLITIAILVTSGTYNYFNTTSTYEQSWVVFLLASMWMGLRGHPLAMTLIFGLALFSKPLAMIYIPMMIAMFYFKKPKHHTSSMIYLSVWVAVFIAVVTTTSTNQQFGGTFDFNQDELIAGFYNWWFYLDTSILVAITIPLVILKLAHLSKSKDHTAKSILIFLAGIILSVSIIEGFTTQLNHAYRFTPLVIFGGAGLAYICWNHVMCISQFYVKYHSKSGQAC